MYAREGLHEDQMKLEIDNAIKNAVSALRGRFSCHTIILYGSYARGDFSEDSDIDIIGFSAVTEIVPHAYFDGNVAVDAWIYPDTHLSAELNSLLHIRGGTVLIEIDSAGTNLLKRLNDLFNEGPKPISEADRAHRRTWAEKMLKRSNGNEAEELYRRTWLVTDALENYFILRNKWYEGPKLALSWLENNDTNTFDVYQSVLRAGTLTPLFSRLIRAIFMLPDAPLQEPTYTRYVILLSHAKPELLSRELAIQHVGYLKQLEQSDHLELCGPFSTYKGGMIILKVSSESEAKSLAEADPFVKSGAQSFELRKWDLSCRANKHMGLG